MKNKTRLKRLARIASEIFDSRADDLSYISENKNLLSAHIRFIEKLNYYELSFQDDKTGAPIILKSFMKFKIYYNSIYIRWMHIVRSCYDKTYSFYPYFGGKGIKVGRKFLNAKNFCIWCLKNGLTSKPFTYTEYLFRKNKEKFFSPKNCIVLKEKDLHECKSVRDALMVLQLIKHYEAGHDSSVSYMSFYTRYFMYDTDIETAKSVKYVFRDPKTMGFSPVVFYRSVADQNCCSESTFLSRIHYSYLESNFKIRPYDMLKPEYSISEDIEKQGTFNYKKSWELKNKEGKDNSKEVKSGVYTSNVDDVYKVDESLNVYND